MNSEQAERHLRYRIVGLLHVGKLKRGDALPSIRRVAHETGTDHRAVAAAYRALEAQGMVEIRRGSGVYLAGEGGSTEMEAGAERWLGDVLLEGWSRRVPRAELAGQVERVAASRVRCACIESNEDHLVALAAELQGDFSLDVAPVLVSPGGDASVPRDAVEAADLVVTTAFHADAGRAAAARAGKPCVVVRVNPAFSAAVARALAGDVTAVIADPRYGARGKAFLDASPHRGRVRFVQVDELAGPPEKSPELKGETVLMTRAARRRLGLPEYHLVPEPTYLSADSARELFGAIVAHALRPFRGQA